MRDPRFPPRLADSQSEGDLVRDVLRAAKGETMGPSGLAKTLARFEATKLDHAGHAGAAMGRGSWWRSPFTARVGVSVAIVCAIGVGLRASSDATTDARPVSPAPAAAASHHDAPAPVLVSTETIATPATTRVEDLPEAPAPTDGPASAGRAPAARATTDRASAPTVARGTATSSAAASSGSSFHEELALVEAARSALARGDTTACLRALDGHDERFREGVFADEIAVMRIEALAARGEHARARTLGERFLAHSPSSTYASRIRSILATAPRAAHEGTDE